MQTITDEHGYYHTPPHRAFFLARWFPSLFYYPRFIAYILKYSRLAKQGKFGDAEWQQSSQASMLALETVGVEIEITGINSLTHLQGPCVFIVNHMSTLETIALPGLIQPYKDCTFILKRGMVEYPVFKHIMIARNPIVVDRQNPREDLKVVLEEGSEALAHGRSVIVFPQTTRTLIFDPDQFNTIGIKLAKRANVPVVPVAVRTDAWGIGAIIKELARIDPSKKVHIAFGEPISIHGRGADEHKQVIEFIQEKLQSWQYPLVDHALPQTPS
ncbi:MAG: lysophospholipid acyltransferase family protein [Chloroflexi bacterium]|nr:lysophospholipid acyltransferase family protein [Chloroflexota bacterium]